MKFLFFFIFSLSSLLCSFCSEKKQTKFQKFEQNPYLSYLDSTYWPSWQFLLGSWGGIRDQLINKGIHVGAAYTSEFMGNPVGGVHRGVAYCSSVGLNVLFDLERILKIEDTDFFTSIVWRMGTNLTTRKIGNQFDVAQLYGNETILLNEVYLQRSFSDEKLKLKAGRLNAGNDFLNSGVFARFVNNAFCGNPVDIFFNGFFSAYPIATWGGVSTMQLNNSLELKVGIYNVEPLVKENKYHGLYWNFTNGSGPQVISQFAYKSKFSGKNGQLNGLFRAGFYYTQEDREVFLGGVHSGNYSGYLLAEQELYCDKSMKGRNLVGFASFIFAPKEYDEFPFFLNGGLVFRAMFKNRPFDATCIGMARGNYSQDLRDKQSLLSQETQSAETIIELSHWFFITKYCFITPDMQYIIRPKGLNSIANAYVLGLQLALIF